MSDQPAGGTNISGDANLQDGDFVGRDKVTHQNIQYINNYEVKEINAAANSHPALLKALKEFRKYHVELHEWKELHNCLNDVLHQLGQFASQIDRIESDKEPPSPRDLVKSWRPISQTVSSLLEWGKSIQYIGVPFLKSDQGLQGAAWAIDMYVAEENLERLLKSAKYDANALLDAYSEFDEKAQTHMFNTDKKLRETANELYNLSSHVLGNLSDE
jgi:hypothetical protein